MAATTTLNVPHLETRVGYKLSNGGRLDPAKPTLVLINSMCTTVALYDAQFKSQRLTNAVNLLAIEPLGHGATRCRAADHFTYWDSALVALQAMDALGVDKAYALGTSQGGWIVARMALLRPSKILGLLPLGTSMDSESAESRTKGCWDVAPLAHLFLGQWASEAPTPDFVVSDDWINAVIASGFGGSATPQDHEFWTKTLREVYRGDDGRRQLRQAVMCLAERDGLMFRVRDIRCPVHWLQGTNDKVFGQTVPTEHIKLFTGSQNAKLQFVDNGEHFMSASSPKEVEDAILAMVGKQ